MLAGPALALPATCLLFAIATWFAPRWHPRPEPEGARPPRLRDALGGVAARLHGAPWFFALVPLGVGLGIPLALGLMPGTAFTLLGALAACTAGHSLLASATGGDGVAGRAPAGGGLLEEITGSSSTWLGVLGLCLFAATLRFSTFDLRDALAAQAATGPGALGGPTLLSAADVLAALVGLVAGAAWVERLPRVSGSPAADALDAAMRCGESALAGTALAATVWGPGVGALLHGPHGPLLGPVALSCLVTLLGVAAISALRTSFAGAPKPALLVILGPVAVIALLAARLG